MRHATPETGWRVEPEPREIITDIPETPAELYARARFRDRMAEEAFDARDHDWFKHHASVAEGYRLRADALRGGL